MTIAEKLVTIAENMPKVYAAGQLASPLLYAARPGGLFWGAVFPAGYHAVMELPGVIPAQGISEMFRAAKNLDALTISFSGEESWNAHHFIYLCSSIRELNLPEGMKFSNFEAFAGSCSNLQEIRGALDLTASSNNSGAFMGCNELREVRFCPGSIRLSIGFPKSKALSAASINSILAGLAAVETTQTLTLPGSIIDSLTATQRNDIATKNWQLSE